MKNKTVKNVEAATKLIADKGYDWNTANMIALNCFEKSKANGMSVEWHIEKIVCRKEQLC